MNINILLQNAIAFFVFALLQIIVFNYVEITSVGVIPAFFVLYILLLPYETPDWLLVVLAFLLGFLIDIFSDPLGLNAASTVFMAFSRPVVLRTIAPRDGYEPGSLPKVYYMGFNWFIKYVASLVFIQQTVYYILSDYNIDFFLGTVIKIFLGSFITVLIITISQYIIFRK